MAAASAAQTASPAAARAEPPVVNVFNWSDYIPPQTIASFERDTGIKVNYDTFVSNEILHAKLVAGRTGYDVVVPSANWAALQIEAGFFRKIDKSLLPNYRNLDPLMMTMLGKVDPGNQYLVNWAWGFITLGINVDQVKKALGDVPLPGNQWALLFDPAFASKLKSCGISMLESATDNFPPALHYLRRDAFSRKVADYEDAAKMLGAIRPFVGRFSSDGYINDLANGNVCLVLGFSGDIASAARKAREANSGQRIELLVPSTGGILFYDNMAIPADAPHPGNAHIFINYILRPEVGASITEKLNYATMNAASTKLLSAAARANMAVLLTDAQKRTMVPGGTVPPELRRVMTRLFTQFKAGR